MDDDTGIEAFKRARERKLGLGMLGAGSVALLFTGVAFVAGGDGMARTAVYLGALGLAGAGLVVFGAMKLTGTGRDFTDIDDDL